MTDPIKNNIEKLEVGYVFTSDEVSGELTSPSYISKKLNSFVANGYIRKLSKGRFYKPEISEFGELPLADYEVVKDLLVKNGKPIGYITGYSVFNKFLLTTQVSAIMQISTRKTKPNIVRGRYKIDFVKQDNIITKDNIPLLQLLDCLRFFKKIPDTTADKSCTRLLQLLAELDQAQIKEVKKLVLNYTPQAVALLGAMLEMLKPQEDTALLLKSLNIMTEYKLGISQNILLNQKKWHIR
ncbi:hypothetical protein FACS1894201_03950 [Bacteroidia bacterium]|nr:hypothetical protein FACS1894201_03950 [Bacteroidia bacterium]